MKFIRSGVRVGGEVVKTQMKGPGEDFAMGFLGDAVGDALGIDNSSPASKFGELAGEYVYKEGGQEPGAIECLQAPYGGASHRSEQGCRSHGT